MESIIHIFIVANKERINAGLEYIIIQTVIWVFQNCQLELQSVIILPLGWRCRQTDFYYYYEAVKITRCAWNFHFRKQCSHIIKYALITPISAVTQY